MKILIVGAGIAGLAIGWRLAEAGASVEILERGRAGRGATWASAGMIAPGVEIGGEESALAHFARESRNAWPAFAAELEQASGCDIGFREDGSLIVAANDMRERELQDRARHLSDRHLRAEWLSPSALRAREPLLASDLRGALHVGDDAQVDNRALGDALPAALARTKARLREGCDVQALIVDKDRARGVVTSEGAIEGDAIVLASGAWLNGVAGVTQGDLPPVAPAKGQMIALEPPADVALPKALVWDEDIYLVPRRGRLIAGATMEEAGFDTSVTREARNDLLAAACRLIPQAHAWRLSEIWAGLRPKTPDSMPVLGETAIAGLFVAGGQFRNGILFAPMVAELMRSIVLKGTGEHAYAAFDPKRFQRA
jgi:glycine oxidase